MAVLLNRMLMVAAILAASAIGGVIVSFVLTPLFWKLERPLGLELAGHSGPAEWVILTVVAVACLLGFGAWAFLHWIERPRKSRE